MKIEPTHRSRETASGGTRSNGTSELGPSHLAVAHIAKSAQSKYTPLQREILISWAGSDFLLHGRISSCEHSNRVSSNHMNRGTVTTRPTLTRLNTAQQQLLAPPTAAIPPVYHDNSNRVVQTATVISAHSP